VPPPYLDGSAAGDYGFDPLRLSANSDLAPWYREAELMNGRWAMHATLGILVTDALGLPKWFEVGAEPTGIPLNVLLAIEVAVMAVLEYKRVEGFQATGKSGFLGSFPFDPFGLDSKENAVKEVKNARLAMVAFLGFASQAAVRGLGPVECLKAHLADPAHVNLFTSSVGTEAVVAVVALSIAPLIVAASKIIGSGKPEDFRPIPW